MPRRTLLSADQRARLFAVPVAEAELARHYMLSPADLNLIRLRRRGSNRLGFAVQLCVLRYPSRPLGPSETPPKEMLAFVADQLGVDAGLFGEYAQRAETRREHALELQQYLGLRTFRLADWRTCLRVGADAAWATDRGEPIVFAILGHLRATNVLLPGAEVLERIGLAARARARRTAFHVLADGLTDADQADLAGLLAIDASIRRSRFAWLRDCPESPAPSNMVELLDRVEFVREIGGYAARATRIHPTRFDAVD